MAIPTTQPAKYDMGKQLLALLLSRPQNPAQQPDILAGGYDPRRAPMQSPTPLPMPRPAGASQVDPEAYAYGGQPQSPVPMPMARPQMLGMSARARVPGAPLSLAPPGGAPTSMDFAGQNGAQWNNQQYQNWWDRAQGAS